MKILLIIILAAFTGISNLDERILNDGSLVVPGRGAEKVLVNEKAKELIGLKGYPDKVSEFEERKELFTDVFKVKSPVNIFFDKIYYYTYHKAVFFIDSNIITAIAGMSNDRITPDSVRLSKGVEYFIFNYGNNNLETLKKEKGNDIIYLYSKYGIALVDDKGDDEINMYLIFPPVK